ncbi:iron uptake system protein EfeO [Jatrophihabitans endophyticus]|uniref:iron uptake system protein EfeO n=1 Tax=Jatrophihabitans endophyticus TaxID=1206085 RepID=UPI001A058BAD|nr:iron uptake system protein EfeO [Jatrophihabitans endophyticus]MBE7189785.1 EfeM/EfeO family lipoprotein [Jatrophihabitans endophyticus]
MITQSRRAVATAGLALLTAASLAACSSAGSGGSTGAGGAGTTQTKAGSRTVAVNITSAKGCVADHTTLPAGALTFKVDNVDANAVSELELQSGDRIVGEKENLPPGFSGTFSVNVPAGKYQLYCPGATPERSDLTVTGHSSGVSDSTVSALLQQATKGYAGYVNTQVAALVVAVKAFDKSLHGTSLKAAQAAYMRARPYYEKIEPVAESFVIGKNSLDADIDVRDDQGVTSKQFIGFHRIEMILFKDKTLKGTTGYGDQLLSNVELLKSKTASTTYPATELANGAVSLLDEVATSKITGEEERYSHIDMLDFANNDEGSEQAFAQLQPALDKIDPTLTKTIQTRFTALDKLVNHYRTDSNPSGFVYYTALTQADKRKLAAAVKAVSEPLSTIAGKVAHA